MTTPYSDSGTSSARGTEGTAFGQVIDAEAYYSAPVAEPLPEATTSTDHSTPAEAVHDDKPALSGVGPEYLTAEAEPEGVDLTTMPPFKDMRRLLPSQRLKVQMETAKVATALPEHLKTADSSNGLDLGTLTSDDLDALTNVIAAVEETVLNNAADREAMTEWLIGQNEPLNAVMAAFTQFTENLGN